MVIIIGNQKGGTGKTILVLLLANFLALEKKRSLAVIEMDYQQALSRKSAHNRLLENQDPFLVLAATPQQYPDLLAGLLARHTEVILVDLPARLEDDDLLPVFLSANVIVCPFTYDQAAFEATVYFATLAKSINAEAEILFVPNRVKKNGRYPFAEQIDDQLFQFGTVSPAIAESSAFGYINSFFIPSAVRRLAGPALETFYQRFISGDQWDEDE
jgi:chromosome partitioning protein